MKLLPANEGSQTHQLESLTMSLNGSACGQQKGSDASDLSKQLANSSDHSFIMKDTSISIGTTPDLTDTEGTFLEYTEEGHPSFVLAGINNLRKQGQFCDIKLVVEDHELPVHRAVLAACSPYLFDFLSCLEETAESQPTYKFKDVSYAGFQYLVDYMYTGRLRVPLDTVPVVYATAIVLKMESATRACASFLSKNLSVTNCIGIITIHPSSFPVLPTHRDQYHRG